MDKQLSFTERIRRLKACAYELRDIGQDGSIDMDLIAKAAEIMLTEAQHMEAATARFAARKQSRETTKADR